MRVRAALMTAAAFVIASVVLTSCNRGATAPASPPPAPLIRFVDAAERAGIDYRWEIPGKRPLTILQTIGNGCAFLDFDGDGNLDVFLVGPRLALYRGDGRGHFEEVSGRVGLDRLRGHFLGCAVADVDGDGYDDLYVSGYRTGLLLRNEEGRAFRDVTRQAGLEPQPWGTSCAFAETVPGSGRLDLYVCNYVVFGPDTRPQLCTTTSGVMTTCGPRYYQPLRNVFYRNLGGLRFTDATRATGAAGTGKALGVAWADFDGSGMPSAGVANDEMPGDLLKPIASGNTVRYKNVGQVAGTAFNRDGNAYGGMGADWGDADNDGRVDFVVATFQNEPKSLFRNDGGGRFSDIALEAGFNAANRYVAFGCKLLDVDNDGWLDLAMANGHVQDNIDVIDRSTSFRQPMLLFHNQGLVDDTVRFRDATAEAGPDLTRKIVGRGLASGDYDNDGRMDMLVADSEGKPLLLHNESARTGHWLGVRLVGNPGRGRRGPDGADGGAGKRRSNRNAYGALLTVALGGRTLRRFCHADGSYLSSSDPRVHFGLGSATKVDSLTVRWPSGRTETHRDVAADRYVTLREGQPGAD